jgi:hypothetical protein
MRIRHFIAPAFALLLVVPAGAQDAPELMHDHHDDYEVTPTYASYHGLGMPSHCCGTTIPYYGSSWHGMHVGHGCACGHHATRTGWLGHRLARRHGCQTCGATSCCGTHTAVQKGGPVQKGVVQKSAPVQKVGPIQKAVAQKAAPIQKSHIQRHFAAQRVHVPTRMMVPQKSFSVVQKSHPVVQKSHPVVQKGHWQKSADCCGPVAHGWQPRPTLCERLHARRALRMQAWDAPCCTDVKGGKGGMMMEPYYEPQIRELETDDEGSILIPPPIDDTEPTSFGPTT